ncbi:MAG: hypothetical protein NTU45_09670 [Planctomycetota bacterium]|nr:hypothetical protein [Planctomycetota bacterium]
MMTARDDGARLELVADLDLLHRRELSAHRQHHVERTLLDGVEVARRDGGRVGAGAVVATAERNRRERENTAGRENPGGDAWHGRHGPSDRSRVTGAGQ